MAVRVTRQVVEVICSPSDLEPSVVSTLSLTDEAIIPGIGKSVETTLSLVQQVDNNIKQVSVENTLSLVGSAEHNFKFASAVNIFTLTDLAERGQEILESLSNVLSLTHATNQNILAESVSNIMNLSHDIILVTNNDIIIDIENQLNLSDTATLGNFIFNRSAETSNLQLFLTQDIQLAGTKNVSIPTLLNLIDTISINRDINLTLESFVSLAHAVGRVFDETGASVLDLQQIAERVFSAANILDLTHAVSVAKASDASNELNLTHAVNILADFVRSASNTLGLIDTVSIRKAIISTCLYDPQVGSNGISTIAPVFGTAKLTLTYPFVTPTTTLVLRNPNFGNTEKREFSRINRESRGGTLLIFRDTKWPEREVLQVTIDALTETQKDNLIQFFKDSLGKEIGLLDDENKQWKGIIIDPDAEITHVGVCNYSVTFQFEGEVQ